MATARLSWAPAPARRPQIAYYTGTAPDPPMPATEEYMRAIASAAKRGGPLLLLVYAYTMYLALLAGGAILSRMLRAAMRLPEGKGYAIFDFDSAIPPAERRRFRANLKASACSSRLTTGSNRRHVPAPSRAPAPSRSECCLLFFATAGRIGQSGGWLERCAARHTFGPRRCLCSRNDTRFDGNGLPTCRGTSYGAH